MCVVSVDSLLLTQCTDVVSDSLHHKVSRFADDAAVESWTPGPHLLLAGLSTNLDLDGTKTERRAISHNDKINAVRSQHSFPCERAYLRGMCCPPQVMVMVYVPGVVG